MALSEHGMPISGILTALYYLAQEAERAGHHDVKAVLRSTIVTIDGLAINKEHGGVADPGTCAVLVFFDQFVKASPAARSQFLETMREEVTGS